MNTTTEPVFWRPDKGLGIAMTMIYEYGNGGDDLITCNFYWPDMGMRQDLKDRTDAAKFKAQANKFLESFAPDDYGMKQINGVHFVSNGSSFKQIPSPGWTMGERYKFSAIVN